MGCHVDASWLIALLDPTSPHHQEARTQLEHLTQQPALSVLTLAQILPGLQDNRTELTKQITKTFAPIIEVNLDIATKSAQLSSRYEVTLSEAVVLASAFAHGAKLLTFDKRISSVMDDWNNR